MCVLKKHQGRVRLSEGEVVAGRFLQNFDEALSHTHDLDAKQKILLAKKIHLLFEIPTGFLQKKRIIIFSKSHLSL